MYGGFSTLYNGRESDFVAWMVFELWRKSSVMFSRWTNVAKPAHGWSLSWILAWLCKNRVLLRKPAKQLSTEWCKNQRTILANFRDISKKRARYQHVCNYALTCKFSLLCNNSPSFLLKCPVVEWGCSFSIQWYQNQLPTSTSSRDISENMAEGFKGDRPLYRVNQIKN